MLRSGPVLVTATRRTGRCLPAAPFDRTIPVGIGRSVAIRANPGGGLRMVTRRIEAAGLPLLPVVSMVGPLARRLVRWLLVWLMFVVAVWATLPSFLRLVDERIRVLQPPTSTPLPFERDGGPDARSAWCSNAERAKPVPTDDVQHRDIDIDLRDGAANVVVAAEMAACGTRLPQVIETMMLRADDADTVREITSLVFGYVTLGIGDSRTAPMRLSGGRGQAGATFRSSMVEVPAVAARPDPVRRVLVTPSAWTAGTTHLRIRFDPTTGAWSSHPFPTRQGDGEMVWELQGSDAFVSATFVPAIDAAKAATRDAAARTTGPGSAPLLLRVLGGRITELRSVWLGITVALPFLLLWSWASRAATPTTGTGGSTALAASLRDGCVIAGSLVAALTLLEVAESLASDIAWLPERFQLFNLGWTAGVCKSALIASALLAFGTWKTTLPRRGSGWPLALLGLLLAVGGWTVDPANMDHFVRSMSFAPPGSLEAEVAVAIELVGALLIAGGVGVEAFRWSIVVRSAVVLVAAVLLVAVADHFQAIRTHLPIVAAGLALPFGWAFVSVSRAWIPGNPRPSIWLLGLGSLVAAALALPPDFERNWSQAWLIGAGAWALVRWWQLPAIVLLIVWFARSASDLADRRSTAMMLEGGSVFVFVLFFWNAQLSLLPLTVQALAGFAVLRWGVFAPRSLSAPTRRHRLISRTIDDLRSFNALARLRQVLQKARSDKLAKGELDAQAWLDQRDRDERVIQRRTTVALRGRLRAMLALNVGARGGPWQRGWQGAVATTIVALPWIATFVTQTRFQTPYATNAATLSQLGIVAFDLLRWPALGFFFLYFYPLLRGVNGIQKGLGLAACLIAPSAAATLVSSATSHGPWGAFALWSLQVFICCMTVGVGLGDLGALRKVGKGPRALIEIYNLGTLTAWFGSIAIAVGAAATTAIASGAGAFLTVGLKLLIPEAQTVPVAPH